MIVVENEVAYDRGSEEAREGQDIGKSVYIFVGSQLLERIQNGPRRICWRCAIDLSVFVAPVTCPITDRG